MRVLPWWSVFCFRPGARTRLLLLGFQRDGRCRKAFPPLVLCEILIRVLTGPVCLQIGLRSKAFTLEKASSAQNL